VCWRSGLVVDLGFPWVHLRLGVATPSGAVDGPAVTGYTRPAPARFSVQALADISSPEGLNRLFPPVVRTLALRLARENLGYRSLWARKARIESASSLPATRSGSL
jgi:hypothetical protein